jgi:hypothetical protein
MGNYDIAQICMNGHTVNSTARTAPDRNEDYCSKCGQRTMMACPACGTDIRGLHRSTSGFDFTFPNYCFKCGKTFPWTQIKLSAIGELVDSIGELGEQERESIKSGLPEIIADSPRTEMAAINIKKALQGLEKENRLLVEEKILDLASENAKKIIFEGLWA